MAFHYSPRIINDRSLILYLDAANTKSYPGTGTVWTDISKSEYNSTLNSVTYNSVDSGSMVFNGSTSNVTCGNIPIGSSGTVNVWFKQDVAVANKGLVGIGTNTWLYIGGSGANTMLGVFNGTTYSSGITLNGSTSWNFASFVWSGTTLTIYLNGGSPISSTISFANSGNVVIGVYPSNVVGSYFNGKISNVQIYNRNLSSDEILQNYNATKSRYVL
jgi:hypothetical protein